MSYDLFFLPKTENRSLDLKSFTEYFCDRRNYSIQDNHTWYSNEDTGVYFCFDFEAENHDCDSEADEPYIASFNLNYYRPHIFGLEAEPEISAFVKEFDLLIDDPQLEGMGRGEFTRQGFLHAWNHGNKFGYKAILSQKGQTAVNSCLKSKEIERYWNWNFRRKDLQQELGENIFVPKIMFSSMDDKISSYIVWTEFYPIALPKTDFVLLMDKLPSEDNPDDAKANFRIIRQVGMKTVLRGYSRKNKNGVDYALLNFKYPSHDLEKQIKSIPTNATSLNGIAIDSILDLEIMQQIAGLSARAKLTNLLLRLIGNR